MNHASTSRAAIAAAAILVLSACGNSAEDKFLAQSAEDIAKSSFKEMRGITSMRMLGTAETEVGMARFDIKIDDSNCVGSFDTDKGDMQLVKNSDGAWFKYDDKFWRSMATSARAAEVAIKTYGGKWIAVEDKNELEDLCDFDALLDGFKVDKDDNGDHVGSGEVEKIGDNDAISISGRDGKKRCTVWIAVEAPHHVVKMSRTHGSGQPEEFYLEEFGREFTAKTPDKEDIVTISQLKI